MTGGTSTGRPTLALRAAVSTLALLAAGPVLLLPALAQAADAASLAASRPPVTIRCTPEGRDQRLSFAWPAPVDYRMSHDGPDVVLSFASPARLELGRLADRSPCARRISAVDAGTGLTVRIRLPEATTARDVRLDSTVIVDIYPNPQPVKPNPPPSAPNPPAAAVPSPAPPSTPGLKSGDAGTPATGVPPGTPATAATLRFSWPQATAAAAFVRGRDIWLVFDQPSQQHPEQLRRLAGEERLAQVEQRPHPRATLLRLTTARPLHPRLERDGLAWVVQLGESRWPAAGEPLMPAFDTADPAPARLMLPVPASAEPIAFTDPADGASLLVVPVAGPGRGLPSGYAYRQFRLLPTVQGVAVAPWADGLTLNTRPDGVELTRPGGLALTPVPESLRAVLPLYAVPAVSRVIPLDAWPAGRPEALTRRQQAWSDEMASPLAATRDAGELALARFYIAAGLAAEALGVLQHRLARRPDLADDPGLRLLLGIARLGLGRSDEAKQDLDLPALAATDEGRLWQSLAAAARGEPLPETGVLAAGSTVVAGYPPPLNVTAGLALLDAAVNAGETATAAALIAGLAASQPGPGERIALAYQAGRLKAAAQDVEGALAAWDAIPAGTLSRPAIEAALARIELLRQADRLSPADAATQVAGLQVTWRGDDLEFRLLDRLGQLSAVAGEPMQALRAWREAISRFPERPERQDIAPATAEKVVPVFPDGSIDRLPPWKAVALFEDFKELVPAEAAGYPLLARYARRLLAADLSAAAVPVLQAALKLPLAAAERGEAGRLLAEARLAGGQPEAALAALAESEPPDLPAALATERRLVAASAQLALGRGDRVLALLAGETGDAAEALRLAVRRRQGDWPAAAAELAQPAGGSSSSPGRTLDLAAALALARDQDGLARLDQAAGSTAPAGPPLPAAEAARLLSRPEPVLAARPDAIAGMVDEAERLARAARQAVAEPPPVAPRP